MEKTDDLMRKQGFIPTREAANKLGRNITTIYRWVDAGKVEGTEVASRRYVNLKSLAAFVGKDAAQLLGLGSEAPPSAESSGLEVPIVPS
jgi:hypothetical protein